MAVSLGLCLALRVLRIGTLVAGWRTKELNSWQQAQNAAPIVKQTGCAVPTDLAHRHLFTWFIFRVLPGAGGRASVGEKKMILGSDHGIWDWANEDNGFCPIDWTKSQSVFTFLKACDGVWDTPYYAESIAMARAAGKLAAPYVWLYNVDPRMQADFWYLRLADEPLIVIDFESYGNSIPDYDDLYNAIERLRELGYTGKIIVYTGHWYWLAHGNTADYWKQFPVWLARYSSAPPQPTPTFAKEIIWQFSASGNPANYGITNGKLAVDEDWFYGTQEQLEELFGGGAVPPIDPPPEPQHKIVIKIRS